MPADLYLRQCCFCQKKICRNALIELRLQLLIFHCTFSSIYEIVLDFLFNLLRPTFKSAVGTASDKTDIKNKTFHQPKSAQRERLFQSAAFWCWTLAPEPWQRNHQPRSTLVFFFVTIVFCWSDRTVNHYKRLLLKTQEIISITMSLLFSIPWLSLDNKILMGWGWMFFIVSMTRVLKNIILSNIQARIEHSLIISKNSYF